MPKSYTATKQELLDNLSWLNITNININMYAGLNPNNKNVPMRVIELSVPDETEEQEFKLEINLPYYENNEKEVDEIVCTVIRACKKNHINIQNTNLITQSCIDEIAKNKNITKVKFGDMLSEYTLDEEAYKKLKTSVVEIDCGKVSCELHDNFDPIIKCQQSRTLICGNTKSVLLQTDWLPLYQAVPKENFKYFKFLNKKAKITLGAGTNWDEIIRYLKANGYNNPVTVIDYDKEQFNKRLANLSDCNLDNIYASDGITDDRIPMKRIRDIESILDYIVEPAKELSPFERYVFAYNVTKRFKDYKEAYRSAKVISSDTGQIAGMKAFSRSKKSRNIENILFNYLMVCVGYSDLNGRLLDHLGIPNIYESINVNIYKMIATSQLEKKYGKDVWASFSEEKQKELIEQTAANVPNKFGGHARRVAYINDPKYNICGLFHSDATWDESIDKDYYVYLALTSDEVIDSKNSYGFGFSADELFYVNNMDEFNEKLNFILTKSENGDSRRKFREIVKSLIKKIKALNPELYGNLVEKYHQATKKITENAILADNMILADIDDANNLLTEIATFIIENNNHPISGEQIYSAVKEVYKTIYVSYLDDNNNIHEAGITNSELDEIFAYNSEQERLKLNTDKFSYRGGQK